MATIAICLACYNRREKTLSCLESIDLLELPQGVTLQVYLLDDASTDGTGDAVRARFPDVRILEGDGHLFWGGGMRRAFGSAIADGHDFYLWLNDDVELYASLIPRVLGTYEKVSSGGKKPVIVVGSSCDPETKVHTYGGQTRALIKPLEFHLVPPDAAEPKQAETMSGNIVLIPAAVAKLVGNIDRNFRHQMGDFDYGLRARRKGVEIWLCAGHVGTCATNSRVIRSTSPDVPFRQRLALLNTPLGIPFRDWLTFAARHGGVLGLLFALASYRKVFFPDKRLSSKITITKQ